MALQFFKIPTNPDIPKFKEVVTLDGVSYCLMFYFNTRMGRWMMDVWDAAGNTQLLLGTVLLGEYPLDARFVGGTAGLPPGPFVVWDEKALGRSPRRTELGNGINLYYGAVNG